MEKVRQPAVAIFLYNRPEYLDLQLPAIQELGPGQIYVFIDGPESNIATKSAQTEISQRLALATSDGYNLIIRHRKDNLGTRQSIKAGLDEVFSREEFCIVLEDDCIPTEAFGEYVTSIRSQVEGDKELRIGTISGNYFGSTRLGPHLSKFPRTWGWATWSHAWKECDPTINLDKEGLEEALDWALGKSLFLKPQKRHWRKRYLEALEDRTMWDAQWTVHNWSARRYSVSPGRNLVANIGNDERAIHSFGDYGLVNWPVAPRSESRYLLHPSYRVAPDRAEQRVFQTLALKGLLKYGAKARLGKGKSNLAH